MGDRKIWLAATVGVALVAGISGYAWWSRSSAPADIAPGLAVSGSWTGTTLTLQRPDEQIGEFATPPSSIDGQAILVAATGAVQIGEFLLVTNLRSGVKSEVVAPDPHEEVVHVEVERGDVFRVRLMGSPHKNKPVADPELKFQPVG